VDRPTFQKAGRIGQGPTGEREKEGEGEGTATPPPPYNSILACHRGEMMKGTEECDVTLPVYTNPHIWSFVNFCVNFLVLNNTAILHGVS